RGLTQVVASASAALKLDTGCKPETAITWSMDLAELFDYSWNCNRLMHRTISGHAEAFERPFETLSAFKTIRDLMAHCVGAEQRWVEGQILNEPVDRYENRAAKTIDELFADLTATRTRTRGYFDEI